MDDRIVLSLLVDNTAGVLARVAGLFSRRGYNIESLTVGVTADPRYSRMTVVSLGDQTVLEQIKNQLNKLEDVRDIKELQPDRSVYRELMMVKVRANASGAGRRGYQDASVKQRLKGRPKADRESSVLLP